MGDAAGIAFVGYHHHQPFGKAEPPSACNSSMTPPFELRRPPSNAAVTFSRYTAGNPNSNKLSSVMVRAWRAPICRKDWLQQPVPTPDQKLTPLPPTHIRLRYE
jgi:hypothetical protein